MGFSMEGNFGALQGRIERTLVDEDLCRAVLSSSAVEERPGGGGGGEHGVGVTREEGRENWWWCWEWS